MMMVDIALAEQDEASADTDLYCLECGYNLRGLTGDPRRCPECFYMNPVGAMAIPAPLITEQLRRMETAPTNCVAAIFFGVTLSSPPLFTALQRGSPTKVIADVIPLVLGVLGVAVVVWAWYAGQFRSSCQANPKWRSALAHYHTNGLAMLGLMLAGPALYAATARLIPAARILLLVVFLVIAIRFVVPLYRRAIRCIQPLQRETAVTIARDRLRRALRKAHK